MHLNFFRLHYSSHNGSFSLDADMRPGQVPCALVSQKEILAQSAKNKSPKKQTEVKSWLWTFLSSLKNHKCPTQRSLFTAGIPVHLHWWLWMAWKGEAAARHLNQTILQGRWESHFSGWGDGRAVCAREIIQSEAAHSEGLSVHQQVIPVLQCLQNVKLLETK